LFVCFLFVCAHKILISFITHERRDFLVSRFSPVLSIDMIFGCKILFCVGKKSSEFAFFWKHKERERERLKSTPSLITHRTARIYTTHGPREFFDFSRTKGTTSKNKETIYYNIFKK